MGSDGSHQSTGAPWLTGSYHPSLVPFLKANLLAPAGVDDQFFIGIDEADEVTLGRVAPIVDKDNSTTAGTAGTFNSAAARAAIIPSANGHTNGRALAKVYGSVAASDQKVLSAGQRDLLRQIHSPPKSLTDDYALGMRFGLGFRLSASHDQSSDYWFGPNPRAFGHTGAGGASVGFADPEAELGFGYTANRFDQSGSYDGAERRQTVIKAVYETLEKQLG